MAERRTVDLDGADFEILEAGRGGRPLLLVHGFTGAKEDFRDAVDPLADEGAWVVAPDLRGHGASAHPAGEDAYRLERFAGDLVGLMAALGWEQADVLGHSMGGMVAQHLVIDRPDLVSRLVLMDTCPGPVAGMDADIMRMGIDLCRSDGLDAVLAVSKMGEAALDTPAHQRMLAEVPGWAEFEDGKFLACSPDMWTSVVGQLIDVEDRLDALRAVRVPTLVVVGDQDTPFLAASADLADAIDGARLVVIPDAGHSPQFENPGPWYDAVSSFLRATSVAPTA
jgi:pimeloyl-ACP methyl ester carboxylesterase